MKGKQVLARIWREDPGGEAHFQEYDVPFEPGMTVLSLIRCIQEDVDPTLAFRNYRCGRGICGACMVKLNGRAVKSCDTLVEDAAPLTIEPLEGREMIRDLAVVI